MIQIDRERYTDIHLLSALLLWGTQTNTVDIQKGVLRKRTEQTTQISSVDYVCLVLLAEAGEAEVKTNTGHTVITGDGECDKRSPVMLTATAPE